MFYRRKIILALLEGTGGSIEKIKLQKLLFLYAKQKSKPEYDFIPYKYGCYSYSAKADLDAMVKRGWLHADEKSYVKTMKESFSKTLKKTDLELVNSTLKTYGNMSNWALLEHTYRNFPYYAINSDVVEKVLKPSELKNVDSKKPKSKSSVLFTIGYEGISIEAYLNKLIKNNVKVLVDVRNRPQSMKYGFSKKRLKSYCESIGLEYIHFPEVGIESDKRQSLNEQKDYDSLFSEYRKDNLTKTSEAQNEILQILEKNKRIALTCFEASHCQCHRSPLAESIAKIKGFKSEIVHL